MQLLKDVLQVFKDLLNIVKTLIGYVESLFGFIKNVIHNITKPKIKPDTVQPTIVDPNQPQ
jgi:phage-related protein